MQKGSAGNARGGRPQSDHHARRGAHPGSRFGGGVPGVGALPPALGRSGPSGGRRARALPEGRLGGACRQPPGHSSKTCERPTRCVALRSARPASSNRPRSGSLTGSQVTMRKVQRRGKLCSKCWTTGQLLPGSQSGTACGDQPDLPRGGE